MQSELIEATADGVTTLTLNRPERLNALTVAITDGLLAALPRLARDPSVGVIVITGAGRGFCAGGDVKRMAEASAIQATWRSMWRTSSHRTSGGASMTVLTRMRPIAAA